MTRAQVEEASQLAALTSALASTLKIEHGLSDAVINKSLVHPVENGDQNMCLELQGHLHEKLATFNVMCVHTLAELVRERHEVATCSALASSGQSADTLQILVGGMEQKEWELVKNKLDFDEATFNVYKQRCSDADALAYHANREHCLRRQRHSQPAGCQPQPASQLAAGHLSAGRLAKPQLGSRPQPGHSWSARHDQLASQGQLATCAGTRPQLLQPRSSSMRIAPSLS